jgi:hypothetical protein
LRVRAWNTKKQKARSKKQEARSKKQEEADLLLEDDGALDGIARENSDSLDEGHLRSCEMMPKNADT